MIRTFELYRTNDETGVSGTGKVVEGVVYSDGTCVVRWIPEESPAKSLGVFDSYGAFIAIHVTPHPANNTEVRFNDGELYTYPRLEAKVRKPRRRRKAPDSGVVAPAGPLEVGVRNDVPKPEEVSQSQVK